MKAFFNFLTGGVIGSLAGWANKIIGLFDGSSLSLRSWQHEADITAAALGTAVSFVIGAIAVVVLLRWQRLIMAAIFLLLTFFLAWRCGAMHDLLASTPMSVPESDYLRSVWRIDYIGMMLGFIAALTSAAAAWWSDKVPIGELKEDTSEP